MNTYDNKKGPSLAMRNIFKYMMENGYEPTFEDNYILFNIEDNTSVLEYDNELLTVRTFFTIEDDEYDMFLEASNMAMLKTFMMKPVIMEDMRSIMFSCETICQNLNDFKRFLPKLVEYTKQGLSTHKNEMRELLKATEMLKNKNIPAIEDQIIETGKTRNKLLS